MQQDRRIFECADIADMIEMQVSQHKRFDILWLQVDLAQDFGDEDLAKTHLPDVLNHSRTVQTTGNWSDRGHGN